MNAPIPSFNQSVFPYSPLVPPISYSENLANETDLPILSGDNSTSIIFRIYNNYGTPPPGSNIATMYNVNVTTYDGASSISHTSVTSIVSELWIYFQENGFGENSSYNVQYTYLTDDALAVGGSENTKSFTYGSDGTSNSYIRAGSSGNGEGMIECKTYCSVPLSQGTGVYSFALSVTYDWSS